MMNMARQVVCVRMKPHRGRHDHGRERDGKHPEPACPCPLRQREPSLEQQDDGREDAALGKAHQKADHQKLRDGVYEARTHGKGPPGQQREKDELLGAPTLGPEAARDLQEQVADGEYAPGKPGIRRADAKIGLHAGEGETNVVTVDHVDAVHQEDRRQDARPALSRDIGSSHNQTS